jgi:hypothetical protein
MDGPEVDSRKKMPDESGRWECTQQSARKREEDRPMMNPFFRMFRVASVCGLLATSFAACGGDSADPESTCAECPEEIRSICEATVAACNELDEGADECAAAVKDGCQDSQDN